VTQNPYPPVNPHDPRAMATPGLGFPIIVGGLVSALVHSMGLLRGELFCMMACCCGFSGLPGAAVAAGMAAYRDRSVRWARGFTVAFLACLLGAGIIGAVLASRGFELPPSVLEEMRRSMEEALRDPDSGLSEADIAKSLELGEQLALASPWVALGGSVLTGGILGMFLAAVINRKPPALPPGYGPQGYGPHTGPPPA